MEVVPPPGVTPNFINPYSQRNYSIITLIICLTVGTLLVWIRIYTKLCIIKSHGWEDYTSGIAWLGLVGYTAIWFDACSYGAGVHEWDVPPEHVENFAKLANIHEAYYAPLIFIVKLSILLMYLRIFVPSKKGKTYYTIHLLIWINLLFYIANFLIEVLGCIPRRKIWNPSTPGKCLNTNAAIIATASFNVVSDFTIFLIPQGIIWRLQMSTTRKIGVSAVFATGLFACISSITRLVPSIRNASSKDMTYDLPPVTLWTFAEVTSGIICGCIPIVPQFFRHFLPKLKVMLTSGRIGRSRGTLTKVAAVSESKHHQVPWEHDIHTPLGNYIELDEGIVAAGRTSNVVHGAAYDSSDHKIGGEHLEAGNNPDIERGHHQGGILKTIRLERLSQ